MKCKRNEAGFCVKWILGFHIFFDGLNYGPKIWVPFFDLEIKIHRLTFNTSHTFGRTPRHLIVGQQFLT